MSLFALLFLDLDRFKNLNDTFGHLVGDDMLKIIARRLQESMQDEGLIARVGGDEFVILVNSAESADPVSRFVLHTLTEPLRYNSHEFQIDGSIGIAIFPDNGTTAEELLKTLIRPCIMLSTKLTR